VLGSTVTAKSQLLKIHLTSLISLPEEVASFDLFLKVKILQMDIIFVNMKFK